MKLRHLGYACINLSLERTTNRTLRLANLTAERVTEVIRYNLESLQATLRWNVENGIQFFRIGSEVVPFASHPAFPLDWPVVFAGELGAIRLFVQAHGLRLSMHPGQYTILNSPREEVVTAAVADVEYHARFLEEVDPLQGTVTIHAGGAYGDKPSALDRLVRNFERLSETARRRLILENDDRIFMVDEVLSVCEALEVPLVFDFFHHQCNPPPGGWEAGLLSRLERVVETWAGRVPKFHLSSRREGTWTGHADYLRPEDLELFLETMEGVDGDDPFDLMIEAKKKDLAVLEALSHLQSQP